MIGILCQRRKEIKDAAGLTLQFRIPADLATILRCKSMHNIGTHARAVFPGEDGFLSHPRAT